MPITINEDAKSMNISPCRKCGAFPRIWSMNYPEIQWIGCPSCDICHKWGAYDLEEMITKWDAVNSADENIVNYLVSEPEDYVFFKTKDLAMQYMQCVGEVGRTLIAIDKYGEELGKDVSGAMKTADGK